MRAAAGDLLEIEYGDFAELVAELGIGGDVPAQVAQLRGQRLAARLVDHAIAVA